MYKEDVMKYAKQIFEEEIFTVNDDLFGAEICGKDDFFIKLEAKLDILEKYSIK